jgi:hypothetical protein
VRGVFGAADGRRVRMERVKAVALRLSEDGVEDVTVVRCACFRL